MKFYKFLFLFFAFSLVISTSNLQAQDDCCDDDSGPSDGMTMEEWQRQMDELTQRRTDLMNQLNSLNADIDALKRRNADLDAQLLKAENDLYGAVGTDKAGVNAFRTKFEACEKKINANCNDDCFKEIQASKIKCLPEFWDRWLAMETKVKNCGKVTTKCMKEYTVVKGDCLYKIAGRKEIYGNSRLWPKIWEANKSGVIKAPSRVPTTIPNPNRIYPGQVLCIPNLTDADKKMMENKTKGVKKTRRKKGKEPMMNMKDVKKDTDSSKDK
ncbi:MAG TPA: LysM peptidoglycan-binding domain-containing protein [Ignavibacteria bacterium]|nr:LysM peptidoglycan-binding domain-containing protein [Ignavibacteria bacterium]